MTKKLLGRVCKHAFQSFHKFNKDHDLITAKITEVYDDGTRVHKLKLIEDFKRPFDIVKPKYRTFKDNRDYIKSKYVKRFYSNQARLARNISKCLFGRPDNNADLDQLKSNPYVFGCQESPTTIFKQKFFDKYPDLQQGESYTVAAFDIEAYMKPDGTTGAVNMASITYGDKVFWCGARSFFKGLSDEQIYKKLKESEIEYLSKDYLEKHNVKIEYLLVNTPGQIIYECIQKFHEYGPDFIVSWNANYDMEESIKALENEGYKLEDVFSDPSVPPVYRDYNYFKGREHKFKEDGTKTSLMNEERFPVFSAPAKWLWFDGMSFYAIKRAPGGKKETYKLQQTAIDEGIEGKLYAPNTSNLEPGSTDWHRDMQAKFPFVYAMYNIQDNFVIEDLNRHTNDYSLSLPSLIGPSDVVAYQSQPTQISDRLSFIAGDNGYVWGTTGRGVKDQYKDLKPSLGNWIALLHTELNEDNGINLYKGLPSWRSRGHGATDDIDVTGAYPHVTVSLNVSNYTTKVEVCRIEGLDDIEFRRFGVNLASSPIANAVTLSNVVHNFPELTEAEIWYRLKVLPFVESSSNEDEVEMNEAA